MCEIENAYVGDDSSSGVTDTIVELDHFQTSTRNGLQTIRQTLVKTVRNIQEVQGQLLALDAMA